MNGVTIPGVSAGSNHVGASEMWTPQVIWPSGAAAAGAATSAEISRTRTVAERWGLIMSLQRGASMGHPTMKRLGRVLERTEGVSLDPLVASALALRRSGCALPGGTMKVRHKNRQRGDRPRRDHHDWASETYVDEWVKRQQAEDPSRAERFQLMCDLFPFPRDAAVSILDIGAGYGPVSMFILDRYPRATRVRQHGCEPDLRA